MIFKNWQKKKKDVKEAVSSDNGAKPLVIGFLYKLVQGIDLDSRDISDIVEPHILRLALIQAGMPASLLNNKSPLDKGQRTWLSEQASTLSVSHFKSLVFYKNLRTFAKKTDDPRLYFRLFLYVYLKHISFAVNELIESMALGYMYTHDSLALYNALGIPLYEAKALFYHKQKYISPLLFFRDEVLQQHSITESPVEALVAVLEMPTHFVSIIQKQELSSIEELIRICYQLDCDGSLDESDFRTKQFKPLAGYLKHALASNKTGVNILLHGEPGVGKTELVKTVARTLNCDLFDINRNAGESGSNNISSEIADALQQAQSICGQLDNILLLVDECEDFFHEDMFAGRKLRKQKINQVIEKNALPTIWITNRPYALEGAYIRRFDMVVEIKSPSMDKYKGKILSFSEGLDLNDSFIDKICMHDGLSIGHIEKALQVTQAIALSGLEAQEQIEDLLNGYLSASNEKPFKEKKQLGKIQYDLGACNAQGDDLNKIRQGIERLGDARILLYGPPGTGKTAYAKYLSKVLKTNLISKKASDLLGAYVGETEYKIAQAFEQAKDKKAVLLIDEVDSFLTSRTLQSSQWGSTMVNEMLTQMENFDGIFIATTNFNEALDPAVARRFDFKIKLDHLKQEQVKRLLSALLGKDELAPHLEASLSKLTELTPGDFALVERKCNLLGEYNDEKVVQLLQEEMSYKQGDNHKIGFLT